jgi:hypothetical protein
MKYKLLFIILAVAWINLFSACSDDEPKPDETDGPHAEEPEPPGPEEPGNKFFQLVRIENLMLDTTAIDDAPTAPKPTVFFSLEEGAVKLPSYAKTNRWDLAFGNLYNSFLSGNNGSDAGNYGFGANGTGGICILAEAFDNVTAIPDASKFRTGRDAVGTDDSGAFGTGVGWYLYDFGGTIMGDGSYDKQHVAYALSDTRTVVVRTARGNYAKIRMISCYQDRFTPDQWLRNAPHMFFTFEYILVPAESTTFEIK